MTGHCYGGMVLRHGMVLRCGMVLRWFRVAFLWFLVEGRVSRLQLYDHT